MSKTIFKEDVEIRNGKLTANKLDDGMFAGNNFLKMFVFNDCGTATTTGSWYVTDPVTLPITLSPAYAPTSSSTYNILVDDTWYSITSSTAVTINDVKITYTNLSLVFAKASGSGSFTSPVTIDAIKIDDNYFVCK